MSLPQELIDEIIGYIPLCDKWSLRKCSQVAKSWTNPSRRRLFAIVEIRDTTFQSWLDTIPPANAELLRHVRSLSYITIAAPWSDRQAMHHVDVLRDYLPSFHRLHHLSLSSMHIPSSDISQQIEIFSAFRHSLSHLSLQHCTVTIRALVALINFFPGLDRLDLRSITHEADGKPASPLCRPLIQKLYISQFHEGSLDILDQLSELGLVFEELTVMGLSLRIDSHILSRIVNSLGVNVKRLRLLRWETGRKKRPNYIPGTGSTLLSRCRGLQELELDVTSSGIEEVDILSSITSASIRKVSFTYQRLVQNPSWYNTKCGIFDELLCRLADRLGRTRELEVDFRIVAVGGVKGDETEPTVIPNSLVRFREKGRIRVVCVDLDESERVVYPAPVGGTMQRERTVQECSRH